MRRTPNAHASKIFAMLLLDLSFSLRSTLLKFRFPAFSVPPERYSNTAPQQLLTIENQALPRSGYYQGPPPTMPNMASLEVKRASSSANALRNQSFASTMPNMKSMMENNFASLPGNVLRQSSQMPNSASSPQWQVALTEPKQSYELQMSGEPTSYTDFRPEVNSRLRSFGSPTNGQGYLMAASTSPIQMQNFHERMRCTSLALKLLLFCFKALP